MAHGEDRRKRYPISALLLDIKIQAIEKNSFAKIITKYHLWVHNDEHMLVEKILNYISHWGKFWFGLIFLGSIFNAILEKFTYLSGTSYIWVLAFGSGALIGLVAKIRGAWL